MQRVQQLEQENNKNEYIEKKLDNYVKIF